MYDHANGSCAGFASRAVAAPATAPPNAGLLLPPERARSISSSGSWLRAAADAGRAATCAGLPGSRTGSASGTLSVLSAPARDTPHRPSMWQCRDAAAVHEGAKTALLRHR
jgi:hypothetical protein